MKVNQQERVALLFLGDIISMLLALSLAFLIGYKSAVTLPKVLQYTTSIITIVFSILLIFFVLDAYTLRKLPEAFWDQAPSMAVGLLISAILTTFVFFFFRNPVPRAVFILFYVFSFCFIGIFRYYISKETLSSIHWRVLIVGDGKRSADVVQVISSRTYLRSEVVGYVSDETGPPAQGSMPHLGRIQDLVSIVKKRGIDHVIVATASMGDDLMKLLMTCMRRKVKVSNFRNVIEETTGKVPIDHLNDNWFILEISRKNRRYFWYAKRVFDITVACVGLCLALPLLPFAALLIKLDSRGPIFYSQLRIGRRNRPFRAWKLRTMVEGADKNNVHWTTENDGRITQIGKLIRKTRFDEMPQLVNILKGDMSLIGPRPEAISLVEKYAKAIPYYSERHMVSPGITGWAQINYRYGNSIEDARQKLMYDFYYIKNRGVILDAAIILKTIRTVLTGKGAM